MKRVIGVLLLLVGSISVSCNGRTKGMDRDDYNIVIIDGCEYIQFSRGYGGYFSHKGDCSNSIHECK